MSCDGVAADALIIGAGPAGAATALALRRAGLPRVVLVDRQRRSRFHIGESAVPTVGAALGRLGLARDLEPLGHRPYHGNLSVWGGATATIADFLRRGCGHGWHLDRAAFDAWLRAQAIAAGAALVSSATLVGLERRGDRWRARLAGDAGVVSASARFLVDATGRRAAVAARLGARRRLHDRLIALATVTPAPVGARLAGHSAVEAVADGWWYAAPLPDGRAIVTLMTDDDIARERRFRDPEIFHRAWAETTLLAELASPVVPADIAVFPAFSQHVDRAGGSGWLVAGDALIGFDPLTSSGIAGALDDGCAAADAILRSLSDGADEAAAGAAYAQRGQSTLRRYLTERRAHYAAERRFGDRPFWLRRHQRAFARSSSQLA